MVTPMSPLRARRRPSRAVRAIRQQAARLEPVSCRELAGRFADLRDARRSRARTIAAAAAITEAVRRTTGKIFYDVQLQGGLALAGGCVAEMQTGEGKTMTTAIGAAILSLDAHGVHVATTNAYLAARDADELQAPLEAIGLRVGRLPDPHDPEAARQAYRGDVTFGTGYAFGFDRLRDEQAAVPQVQPLGWEHLRTLAGQPPCQPDPIQPGHDAAIVDEADSVLIDEATMPLVLSCGSGQPADAVVLAAAGQIADVLVEDIDYRVDAAVRSIKLTTGGWDRIHGLLSKVVRPRLRRPWSVEIQNALRARLLLAADIDYVVRPGDDGRPAVQIIDANTGRIHPERTWQDGLHQAVEQQAGVPLSDETRSDGRISRQRYFQSYRTLAGLTGTAAPTEFAHVYRLATETIPTHRPNRRRHLPSRAFGTAEARDAAIVADVGCARRRRPQPILIGTRTVAHSERLSERLAAAGVDAVLLNGLQDADEAAIVAGAGRAGAITIATNMAGRGTDIKPDDAALEAGGLHVIIAEPNPSGRIDRQLAGRAARQGQPGTVRAYVAAEDDLFVAGRSRLAERLAGTGLTDREAASLVAEVGRTQTALDADGFARRRRLVQADAWRDRVMQTLAGTAEELDA